MDAMTKLQATATIPDEAFAKGMQNLMAEREYVPGLDQALAEIPENERFGITPDLSGEEVVEASAGEGGDLGDPPRRAANDGKSAEGE
jgi:hypothetical protein